jgi:4-aminobutyrate--pyruvate transaminase
MATSTVLAGQPASVEARDARWHLHPNTDARLHERIGPLVIERGDGVHVIDSAGRRYIEAMAGLWSVALGFSERRLAEAAFRQLQELPFYHNFNGRAVRPAVDLAERLIALAPVPMSKVFFANSGSEANDTVLKMIWYRANAMGQNTRKKVIARRRGFHGVTVGAASLTGLPMSHGGFDLPIPQIRHVGCPHHWREGLPGETEADFATRLAQELEALIQAEGPETVAAFVAEPVMAAGGVIVPPETYWDKIQAVLERHDVLLVADEVVCGFGRTGRMFGSQTLGMRPDIMVMSKQLASSYMPIAAVMISDRVFGPIADESARRGQFGHGVTAGGHPVSAAVALENLRIIEERDLVAQAARVGAHLRRGLAATLQGHPLVGEIRGIGFLAGIELVADRPTRAPWERVGRLGTRAAELMLEAGVILRAMGDTLALCPPLIATEADVDAILAALPPALDALSAEIA